MSVTFRQQVIVSELLGGDKRISHLKQHPLLNVDDRTLQRDINRLIETGFVQRRGEARSVTYSLASYGRLHLILPIERLDKLFADEKRVSPMYDFSRLETLSVAALFDDGDSKLLDSYNSTFQHAFRNAPVDIIRRERERIMIELSWKSSQLEGNTYSLLETETLLKEGIAAPGKSQMETIMVLNHKKALDFARSRKELFKNRLSIHTIVELHRLLAEELFDSGIRQRPVGIIGSTYRPLDNKYQIEEELQRLCAVINKKTSVYEKALIAFTHICYLQPFNDGNKRTGRILANAILDAHDSFPLSLRAVDANVYKLALLAYYEYGVLGNIKEVFVSQAEFAAKNYAT